VARRLPYEHHHGLLVETVRSRWAEADAFVLVGAVGIAVRAVAPLLSDKRDDPAVVCVDDAGRFAVCLVGGHAGGGNALAREVAAILGADPVITTATDGMGLPGLDALPGLRASGDVAGVTRQWLDGTRPHVHVDDGLLAWPLPAGLAGNRTQTQARQQPADEEPRVTITDSSRPAAPLEVLLRPASIVVGVGAATNADTEALWDEVATTLAEAGIDISAVAEVGTLDRKAAEPAIVALAQRLGVGLRTFAAPDLAAVASAGLVPNPSPVVAAAVETPSVAEAAALLGAGTDATLVSAKRVSRTRDSTVALARRARPPGQLAVVGLGPGDPALRTPAATTAIRGADTVMGYAGYVDLVGDLVEARQLVVRSPIGAERDRCCDALDRAARGERVALVCSGDAGVYAMASLVLELAPGRGDPPVEIVPGITAALSAAAVLGAPLGHDHAAISLSDLLTPWEVIVRRLEAAAVGDFVVSLYNPRSRRRSTQLARALAILAAHRPSTAPAAVLTEIGRPGAHVVRTTLADLDPADVGMLSLVVVGATSTRWIGSHMVTPRGYSTSP
jgi:cobalt-precorrin 5A hydrolase/precorrin-3B C17-methyltransferase